MPQPAHAWTWRGAADLLGAWNLYFIAKLALFAMGLVGLHPLANIAFAAGLAAMAHPRARRWRPWMAAPVAAALFYYDSWLPGLARAISQAGLVASFSGAYLAELAGRFVSVPAIAALAAAAAAWFAASRFVRLDVPVALAVLALGFAWAPAHGLRDAAPAAGGEASGAAAPQSPDAFLAGFFAREAARSVAFAAPPAGAPPFDVIFVHICSLSWDDLAATGLEGHRLFKGFDILLKRFNSVSTYSGPAAIRFLRAPCGQQAHTALYAPAAPQCLLMPDLQAAGFEPQLLLNHDGHFDGFLDQVRAQGLKAPVQSLEGLDAPLRAFDDSRVYDDAGVLGRWLDSRAGNRAPRAAVYFNTLSLHDGNRLLADPAARSSQTYKRRLERLLDDIDAFMGKLAARGRRAVVVVIPEHGAALRGDAAQIPGLRDIPTPAITLVPVGIRVIGPDAHRAGEPVVSSEPTSFLAVSAIVSRMLAKPPFGPAGFQAGDYASDLPATEFVAQGETATLVRRGDAYLMRLDQDPWKEYR